MPPIEGPITAETHRVFGSDVVARTLRDLEIPYIALVPGSSFRGLHDSIVNALGNTRPQMLVCMHEEAAVAIAHGYGKVRGRAMAVALHANVGLLHGSMAIFNAWCDRMPMLILGGTGPMDAAQRRPWIEWIHTSRDQGALVRHFVKWDDMPFSAAAAQESVIRAKWIADTAPCGPTYVNLDAGVQEGELESMPAVHDVTRYAPSLDAEPGHASVQAAADLLSAARHPVILMGRVSRNEESWTQRIALAEALGAKVITDLKIGAAFPTDHPLHAGVPGLRLSPEAREALISADVVLSLDWVDLAGTMSAAGVDLDQTKVIQVSLDHTIHNGWNMDHQALAAVDLFLSSAPCATVPLLLGAITPRAARAVEPTPSTAPDFGAPAALRDGQMTIGHLASALRAAVGARPFSLTHLPLSWNGGFWPFRHPLDYLGSDGGGGVGGGPGIAVGAALALREGGRLPIAVCGDGDFMMGHTALWTAVHYEVPALFVVANNRSYFNDERHQQIVAEHRERPVENRWIGQRLTNPEVDIAGLARAQGAVGYGPVTQETELGGVLEKAVADVEGGHVAVVDVRIATGYA